MKGSGAGMKRTGKRGIFLWVSVVYGLSFMCYVPMLLERRGTAVPGGVLWIRYLFVCVPAIAAVWRAACEHDVKRYFARMFSGKITRRQVLAWALVVAVGILISGVYSLIMGIHVFRDTYSSITALLTGCGYLFATALVEEAAWRGFLLERISWRKNGAYGIVLTGIIWAVWHMPMWMIRNSLDLEQAAYLCIWTVLVSIVLGAAYCQCRNVLFAAALHASFNICYAAPIQYNIAGLAAVMAMGAVLGKNRWREFGK